MLALTEEDNKCREMFLNIQGFTMRLRRSKTLTQMQKDHLWRMAKTDLKGAEDEFARLTSGYNYKGM